MLVKDTDRTQRAAYLEPVLVLPHPDFTWSGSGFAPLQFHSRIRSRQDRICKSGPFFVAWQPVLWIRIWSDPELFVPDRDPAKYERADKKNSNLSPSNFGLSTVHRTVVWNSKWQILGLFFILIKNLRYFFLIMFKYALKHGHWAGSETLKIRSWIRILNKSFRIHNTTDKCSYLTCRSLCWAPAVSLQCPAARPSMWP